MPEQREGLEPAVKVGAPPVAQVEVERAERGLPLLTQRSRKGFLRRPCRGVEQLAHRRRQPVERMAPVCQCRLELRRQVRVDDLQVHSLVGAVGAPAPHAQHAAYPAQASAKDRTAPRVKSLAHDRT
eukprot:486993-Pleurochrysis_carterae.AAC.2